MLPPAAQSLRVFGVEADGQAVDLNDYAAERFAMLIRPRVDLLRAHEGDLDVADHASTMIIAMVAPIRAAKARCMVSPPARR
jgi:hypothetical protein